MQMHYGSFESRYQEATTALCGMRVLSGVTKNIRDVTCVECLAKMLDFLFTHLLLKEELDPYN